jgi:hypothetical protein
VPKFEVRVVSVHQQQTALKTIDAILKGLRNVT